MSGMDPLVVNILHDLIPKKEEKRDYPFVMVEYTAELYGEIMDSFEDYHTIGYTVCGAQDPAVIYVGDQFRDNHPELKNYSVVRVIDRYLNEWSSETLLEFSNVDITDEEYEQYEKIMEEEDE